MENGNRIGKQFVRNNTKLLELTVQDAQEEIFWVEKEGAIIYANNSACETLGYTQEEFLKLKYTQIDHFVSDAEWKSYWDEIKQKSRIRFESDHINSKGEKVPVQVSVSFIELGDEELISIFCHNIFKRRKVEEALRSSEEQFRLIAEKSIDGILHLNKEGNVLYSSPSSVHFFDQSSKDIFGLNFRELIDPDYIDFFSEGLESAFEGEKVTHIDFSIPFKDSEPIFVSSNMVRFYKSGSEPLVQLILRDVSQANKMEQELDKSILAYENILVESELLNANLENEISERKKIQEELVDARKQAELANKAKSEFLANMSHEIRTPLNAVLGFSEILRDKLSDQPDLKTYVDGINTGGKSLLSLINDILDLSKIEAGRLEIQKEPVNPKSLIYDVEQIFGKKIIDKGLMLMTELSIDIPQALIIDHTRIRQILFNLVGNAIKFTSRGSVGVKIESKPKSDTSGLVDLIVHVSDTGMGIPEEQQRLIYEPFKQQEGQSTRKFGGTGLGLSITKRLTEMMNGTLHLQSEPNKGSVFSITFKDVEVASMEDINDDIKTVNLNNIRFEGSTILLVEDTISNQQVFLGLLESTNLNIHIANNGKEALDIIPEIKPNLVFMDLRMPVMDGNEATKRIRSDENLKDLPVIALSASLLKNYDTKMFAVFDEALAKPINRTEILNVLIKYLPHSFIESNDGLFMSNKDEIEPELVIPQMADDTREKLVLDINKKISPLLLSLREFFDAEDASKLTDMLIQLGKQYEIEAYMKMAKTLQNSVKSFDLSKTESLLISLENWNNKI